MIYTLLSIVALIFACLFILTLVVLHFLEPEFDPKWRMISEYEIGKYGYLMQGAFFSWGASVLFLLIVAWHFIGTAGGIIGCIWFIMIMLALVGAGIYKTNAITDNSTSRANTIHTFLRIDCNFNLPDRLNPGCQCLTSQSLLGALHPGCF